LFLQTLELFPLALPLTSTAGLPNVKIPHPDS